MFFKIFCFFVTVPFLEMVVLFWAARSIGIFPTIFMVVFTAALGSWLARVQGLSAWMRLRTELQHGQMPTDSLIEGVLIFCAGLLLLTPGFLSDTLGFLLLTPFFRAFIREWIKKKFLMKIHSDEIIIEATEIH